MRNKLGSFLLLGAILFGISACSKPQAPTPDPEDVANARLAAKELGTRLKGKLMAAMSEGGPSAAIEVCSKEAPAIAAEVSEEFGMDVGRTSLRIRNPGNVADDWEVDQLQGYMKAIASGQEAASLESAEILTNGDKHVMRWGKPILLEGPCAMCHGQNVAPEISELIAARYPDDQATGFAVGEVRGMFTVEKPLN